MTRSEDLNVDPITQKLTPFRLGRIQQGPRPGCGIGVAAQIAFTIHENGWDAANQ